MSFIRDECLTRLRNQIASGRPIIGGGAGTGISAKCAEAGGIDLIIIYNSGRFRMAGRGSLSGMMPYGDANQIVVDMAREVLPVVRNTPVLAGVCGTDPFRIMKLFLRDLKAMGFSGVQNFPTVGLIDGTMRQGLEETDMGFDKEVEMIRLARELDMLTCPYVFTEIEAEAMAKAGADVLIPHMGLTTKGSIGANQRSLWMKPVSACKRCMMPRSALTPTSWSCATAGRYPNRPTRRTCSSTPRESQAFSVLPVSNAYQRKSQSPTASGDSKRFETKKYTNHPKNGIKSPSGLVFVCFVVWRLA